MPPSKDLPLRWRALRAYRRHGSYRRAAKALGVNAARTHELVREALRMEMEEANDRAGR